MIIVSENQIINFDNIIDIKISDCDGDFVISAEAVVGTDDIYIELGYYKTEKRANAIVKEIVNKYKQYNLDNNKAVTLIPKVYEMPKE